MAIIYSYPNGSSALASDTLTITRSSIDFPVPNPTFTLTVAQIAAFVQSQLAGGTPNYIPVFNTSNTIIDSSMYLDDFATPTLLTIGNDTKVQGNLILEQDQADTTITIISDASNIGEQHNPSIQFVQDGGVQNAAIGFNIVDDTGGGTIPGTGNRFWIVNAMDDTIGAGGITFGTAQVDGWDNAIARFMIRGDGKGLFGHPNANYTKTLDSQFEIYDDRTENSTSDYSLSVLGIADTSDPGGTGGAGGIISRLNLVNGVTPISSHAIGMVTGTTSSEILATGDLAFYAGSDMDTSSATGFAGVINSSGNWQIGGIGPGGVDSGYQLYVAGDAWVSGALLDSGQNEGTAGQVLTSTGTGTAWAGGSTGTVIGVGQTGKLPLWTDGPAGEIGDSQLTQFGPSGSGLYQIKLDNADRFIINKPSTTTSGDPEYLIQQDGNHKVSMGWDDDGAGFGYLYNWAGNGWRFGSAGNNPELTIVTTAGSQGVEVVNNFSVGGLATIQGDISIENGLLDGNGLYGNTGQVLSSTGAGQNVVWADSTVGAFKEVNEGNGLGIVKQSRNSNYYAPIGNEAFDASHSGSPSSTRGAGGDYSVALGENSSAIGNYSFSFGNNVRAFSDYDIVLGHDSEATGGNSVSLGYNNIASGPVSTAIGYFANASGDNSVAIGWRVNATAAESNVFGKYNLTTDELFVVGNGDNSQRSDLLVGKDSGVILAPSLEISEILDPKCLITLEYITTIAAGVIGTGTEGTIPVWINGNPSVTIADSIITQTSNPNPKIVISGALEVNGAVQLNDTLAVTQVATFDDQAVFEAEANFQDEVTDSTSSPGTAGQVLSSTGDKVLWVDYIEGNVTGTGTNLTVPMWSGNNTTNNLADSSISFTLVDPGNLNDYGMQFGGFSLATGQRNSIAIGYNNRATMEATLATGHGTTASGLHAASFNFSTTANGNKSAAFGNDTLASGTSSFAIGNGNTAATSYSFAGGLNSTANPSLNGTTGFAYGNALNITGQDAAGFGKGNTATGKRNFVAGSNNQVAGDNSFSIGANNTITAGGATAIGSVNDISMFGSFAIGQYNVLNSNIQTAAFGYNLVTGSRQYQTVVGNSNIQNSNAFFVVGTGIDDSLRKNGLEVYRDKVVLPEYGSGNVVGDSAYNLEVTTEGKIIETVKIKKYVSLITQAGANNAPTIINNLENTLDLPPGGFVGWTWLSSGEYNLELTGAFDKNKTVVFINGGSAENNHDIAWEVIDSDNLVIRTHNSDGRLTRASLEIRTY